MHRKMVAFIFALSIAAALPAGSAQAKFENPATCAARIGAVEGRGGFVETAIDFFAYLGVIMFNPLVCR